MPTLRSIAGVAAALILTACASTPRAPVARAAPAKPATKAGAATVASSDGTRLVCTDQNPTGSNIKRRQCERLSDEQIRERRTQAQAMLQGSGANSGPVDRR